MSFLKNILGAFVEFNEESKAKESAQNPPQNEPESGAVPTVATGAVTPAAGVSPATQTTVSPSAGNVVPSQYQKHFQELIEEANHKNPLFQGTDFKEFIDSKGDIEGIADEATRYKTTFNVLKRTGLTKEKLVTTGREYVNIIDRDVKAFETVYQDQYKAQVEQKEQQLHQKAQELQKLNEKIQLLNKEMTQMGQEILTSKERLNNNKNAFVAAAETVKNEIESELKKIDQYFS